MLNPIDIVKSACDSITLDDSPVNFAAVYFLINVMYHILYIQGTSQCTKSEFCFNGATVVQQAIESARMK